MRPTLLALVALMSAPLPSVLFRAEWSPREIRSPETVRLLNSVHLDYEAVVGGAVARLGFALRLFHYEADDGCQEAEQCALTHVIIATSAFDEQPEQHAFSTAFPGTFKSVTVLQTPKRESGAFVFSLETARDDGAPLCRTYTVSLAQVRFADAPCK